MDNSDSDLNININEYVGIVIHFLRKKHGLSGRELGNMVDMSQQQISRYENAKSDITLKIAEKLAAAFNYTLLQFIAEVDLLIKMETYTRKNIASEIFIDPKADKTTKIVAAENI